MEPINETTIRQLLARYLEGETSLAQEQQLAAYFTGNPRPDMPPDLLPYRTLFSFFQKEAAMMPPDSTPQRGLRVKRNLIRIWTPLATAAGIALFFALFHPSDDDFVCYKDGKRIRDRKEAILLAQHQLGVISGHTQKAGEILGKMEMVANQTEVIYKYIQR